MDSWRSTTFSAPMALKESSCTRFKAETLGCFSVLAGKPPFAWEVSMLHAGWVMFARRYACQHNACPMRAAWQLKVSSSQVKIMMDGWTVLFFVGSLCWISGIRTRMSGGGPFQKLSQGYSALFNWPPPQVLGGFESGRVAVFRSFFPDEIVSETGDKKNKKTLEEACWQNIDFRDFHGQCDGMPTHHKRERKQHWIDTTGLQPLFSHFCTHAHLQMSNDLKPYFSIPQVHSELQVMEERQRIKSLANGEPILQAFKIVGVLMGFPWFLPGTSRLFPGF